jgi:SAM-dependent methyltransferase
MVENDERTPQNSGRFDSAHAAAWHKLFHIIENASQPVSDLKVERAGRPTSHRLLHVATGMGEPTITAARRVAQAGFVEAIDISEDMLGFGRARAAALSVTKIAFRRMGAEEAGQSAAAYDVVLRRWGLMFMDGLDAVPAGFRESRCKVRAWSPPFGAARGHASPQPRRAGGALIPQHSAARRGGQDPPSPSPTWPRSSAVSRMPASLKFVANG